MDLSVIIPTRDRREKLLLTLGALDQQKLEKDRVELIVVDDGSLDGTCEAVMRRRGALPTSVLAQPRRGASAARNRGIEAAHAPLLLLLGDDTRPAHRDLLASHIELHRQEPDPLYATLGRIAWASEVERTPFLHWLDRKGFQYHYDHLRSGLVEMRRHFYSSHVSVKRSAVLDVGRFDEQLTFIGEDTELGIRLARAGGRLDYHPELLVHHHHPQTVEGYTRRMEIAGRAARLIHDRWPRDIAMPHPSPIWLAYPVADLLARVLVWVGVGGRLRENAWWVMLMAAYRRGYRSGTSLIPQMPSGDRKAAAC